MAGDDLGTRIRRARERKRWTQQQLADAIGVGVRAVGTWERGKASPRNAIGAVEHVLGVDLTGAAAPDPVEEAILGLDLDPRVAAKLVERYRELTAPGAQPSGNGGRPHSTTG